MNIMEQLTKIKELLFEEPLKIKMIEHELIVSGEPCSITITNNTDEVMNDIQLFRSGVDYGDKITIKSNTLLSYEDAIKVISEKAPFIGYTYFKFDEIQDIGNIGSRCLFGSYSLCLVHDPYQKHSNILDFKNKYQINGVDKFIELRELMPNKSLTIHIFPNIDYKSNFKPNYWTALKISIAVPFEIVKMWIKSIIK